MNWVSYAMTLAPRHSFSFLLRHSEKLNHLDGHWRLLPTTFSECLITDRQQKKKQTHLDAPLSEQIVTVETVAY